MSPSVKIAFPIVLTLLLGCGLLLLGVPGRKMNLVVSGNPYVNKQVNYQVLLLVLTGISLLVTCFLNKKNFLNYFSLGQINAPGEELKVFGMKKGDSWSESGLSLLFIISGVTAVFMYFQLKKTGPNWSVLQSGILWIIFFSLTNSFGEEMIFRLGIVSPLKGLLTPITVCFISAILFGLPHFFGMPNGIVGVLMAGVLGFVLAKSMIETNGFFWAWLIHFAQDVIIIGSLFLMGTGQSQ
jgi:hypothetical protein